MTPTVELLLVASPEVGHLLAEFEFARQLTTLNPQISVAILIPTLPFPNKTLHTSIADLRLFPASPNLHLIELPPLQNLPSDWALGGFVNIVDLHARLYIPLVKSIADSRPIRTAGIVFDMFCAPMVDLAADLGVPSYLFYSSGANMLVMSFAMEALGDPDLPSKYSEAPPESTPVNIPGFHTPVPRKVWPLKFVDKMMTPALLRYVSEYRRAEGILVNTFEDLDSDLLHSLSSGNGIGGGKRIPPVYAVGPILHISMKDRSDRDRDPVLSWLDEQSRGSVVFLCFGSYVESFEKVQVEQIAAGLERSGRRFVWALRASPLEDILPEGFLERTKRVGRVIGWARQTDYLAHEAVGAFVSHCGWNSVLESLWFGVPLVTWPMYAEQQLNAFLLVKELGLAVNLRMDYRHNLETMKGNMLVGATEVEAALRRVMDEEEGAVVRRKVKEMSGLAREAVEVGGSSSLSLSRFVQDFMKTITPNLL